MVAKSPEALDTLFAQALNAGDLDALTALYESDASLMPARHGRRGWLFAIDFPFGVAG